MYNKSPEKYDIDQCLVRRFLKYLSGGMDTSNSDIIPFYLLPILELKCPTQLLEVV